MQPSELIVGEVYKRKALHDSFGGQRNGGISTPSRYPVILLFTNESGSLYGYSSDGQQQNGLYWYTGEGQEGDMKFVRGNRAILEHESKKVSLLLFEGAEKSFVRYIGEALLVGHHETIGPDKNGNNRKIIVFELELRPSHSVEAELAVDADVKNLKRKDMSELRMLAMMRSTTQATSEQRIAQTYRRSEAIKLYVRKRANGFCEACKAPAPFLTKKGEPYLEPHHTTRLADGGPDHPRYVAAICPTCHRRIHSGADGEEFNQGLRTYLEGIESE